MENMINLTIDGVQVSAPAGSTVDVRVVMG